MKNTSIKHACPGVLFEMLASLKDALTTIPLIGDENSKKKACPYHIVKSFLVVLLWKVLSVCRI